LTKITPFREVDSASVQGILYMLNDGDKFQAYEFEKGEPIYIPPAFLHDLCSTIHKFVLEKCIALDVTGGPANQNHPRSLEYAAMATEGFYIATHRNHMAEFFTLFLFSVCFDLSLLVSVGSV
jgi:hypothetical protein